MGARKREARRAPFVVTVAFAAAAGACGGSVAGSGTGTGGTGGSGGTGGGIGNPPACPASLPEQSASCGSIGLDCQYSMGTDPCGQERIYRASCAPAGAWDISMVGPTMSCNPPPPPDPNCPTLEPSAGNWCNVVETQICGFAAECCPTQYQCINNQWQLLQTPCDPPDAVCPATRPTQGDPCEACGAVLSCNYDECTSGASYFTASCAGGSWSVTETPCVGGG